MECIALLLSVLFVDFSGFSVCNDHFLAMLGVFSSTSFVGEVKRGGEGAVQCCSEGVAVS